MKAMKKLSTNNTLKSLRGNALKEMAEKATSLREITSTNVARLKQKKIDVKGIMIKVGMKKVIKRRKAKDADGTSVGSQQSPVSVSEVEPGEDVEYENVTLYAIKVDDSILAAKGFDPPAASSIQKEIEQVDEKAEEMHKATPSPTEATKEEAQEVEVAPASESEPDLEKEQTDVAPKIAAENLLQVVLLLTDAATTHRFELIKLDFDSTKSHVEDILKEIPSAATEESLRVKKYVAICSKRGDTMDNSKLLSDYFRPDDNETVSNFALAVPEGMSAKECARAASPILSDNKILSMANISVEENEEKKTDNLSSTEPKDLSTTETTEHQQEAEGNELKPKTDPNISTLKEIVPELDTSTPAPISPSDAGSTDSKEVVEAENAAVRKTQSSTIQVKSETKRAFISTFAIFFVAAFSTFVKQYNERISSPLGPGDILRAGEKRHKCGVLRFFPEEHTGCHSMTLENDGIGSLELYDGEELLWQIYVLTCDEGCAVTMNDDGKVFIGDREGFFSTRNPSNISPWPFRLNVKNSFKKMMDARIGTKERKSQNMLLLMQDYLHKLQKLRSCDSNQSLTVKM